MRLLPLSFGIKQHKTTIFICNFYRTSLSIYHPKKPETLCYRRKKTRCQRIITNYAKAISLSLNICGIRF